MRHPEARGAEGPLDAEEASVGKGVPRFARDDALRSG